MLVIKFNIMLFCNSSMTTGDSSVSSDSNSNLSEVNSKTVAAAFWAHQLEQELRESGMEGYVFADSSSQEDCMDMIDAQRAKSVYSHLPEDCSDECKRRGNIIVLYEM